VAFGTGTHYQNRHYSLRKSSSKGHITPTHGLRLHSHAAIVYSNSGADFKDLYFLDDDYDDEDSETVTATEYRCPARIQSAVAYLSYASLLDHSTNCFGAARPAVVQATNKYLMLGVLRI
jgi:hypothetical protein